ncbi:hypothetical protein SeMB42_g07172 [Synchytrium endobioticum]|uniref:RNA helicase n=1 Tax=Synchytrium endobioticum TaxID=286115 RepID=A0A507CBT9_9FUNG|nr:hypothetical protein SeMB42_g07172 [Synchytrium endobioticum]TPX50115.1 hypothetical protein SeLEV6574_g01068 [Synchytrium endobioticum]
MGRRRARYNEKARASSHTTKTALPHARPRHRINKDSALIPPPEQASSPSENQVADALGAITDEPLYQSSDTAVPHIIVLPKAGTKAHEILAKLPHRPEGKISAKKRKRLEKFIEQSLKKEERKKLIEKLSNHHFSSDMLQSSKRLGQKVGRLPTQKIAPPVTNNSSEEQGTQKLHRNELMDVDTSDEDEHDPEKYSRDEGFDSDDELDQPSKRSKTDAPAANVTTSQQLIQSSQPTPPTLHKQERKKPIQTLPTLHFSSGLLQSSKLLGRTIGHLPRLTQKTAPCVTNNPSVGQGSQKLHHEKTMDVETSDEDDLDIEKDKGFDKDHQRNQPSKPNKTDAPADNVATSQQSIPPSQPTTPTLAAIPAFHKPKAFYISLPRPPELAVARISLPVTGEEQPIMETITYNDVTILCGATGSGKTTQVPQFLLEAGFGDPRHPIYPGIIGVTQPRRVAAISVAKRVAEETGLKKGEVAYQIRFDATTVKEGVTRLKFMTDGILLRELSTAASAGDAENVNYCSSEKRSAKGKPTNVEHLLLTKYSCIIVDEAHERTLGTDILVGWLARLVKLRNSGRINNVKPLKLVVMSATLRVEDFTNNTTLFPPSRIPPVINVEGRQFKVTIHYNRKTPDLDYLGDAYKKICKIHTRLPPGGILVFLTGQGEIQSLVGKLRRSFPPSSHNALERDVIVETRTGKNDVANGLFEETETGLAADEQDRVNDFEVQEDGSDDGERSEEDDVDILDGDSEGEGDETSWMPSEDQQAMPLHVLPLYSLLPTQAQLRVFEVPPPGSRLCIVATNVAETSLTIPNIRYVIDTGKVKERLFDSKTGTQTYSVKWTSKASANQRSGRAGRVGVGHCYRLFSSAVFHDGFEEFTRPEILKTPVEGVVLQMKAMGIHQVINFPFPTPPDRDALRVAEKLLIHLGAIDPTSLRVTGLGRLMARFPVSPRYAKMLAVAVEQSPLLLAYTVAMVAGLSSGDPFIRHDDDDDDTEVVDNNEKERRSAKRKEWFKIMQIFGGDNPTSDSLKLLHAVGAYAAESTKAGPNKLELFCDSHYIRFKAMSETTRLRRQLTTIIQAELASHHNVKALTVDPFMPPPNAQDSLALRQIIYSGFPDRIAKLVDENGVYVKKGVQSGKPVYTTMYGSEDEIALIHPSSSIFSVRPAPKYLAYEEVVGREERMTADGETVVLSKSEMKIVNRGDLNAIANAPMVEKKWLKGVTVVSESWMTVLGPSSLCTQNAILETPLPKYDAKEDMIVGFASAKYGPKGWELPIRQVPVSGAENFVCFARELLAGKVALENGCPKKGVMARLCRYLVAKPSILNKAWSKSQSRVIDLLNALSSSQISSRNALLLKWVSTPTFLRDALMAWFPPEVGGVLKQHWPPVAIEVHLGKVANVRSKPLLTAVLSKLGQSIMQEHSNGGDNATGRNNSVSDADSS